MLVNCVAYQDGRKLADIEPAHISDYLKRPGCFVWVALKDPTDAELAQMQAEFDLHELAVEDARHGHQRPKIEEYPDLLFTVLHTVELLPTDELQVGEVDVFVGRNFVLSVRSNTERGFKEVRARVEREPSLPVRHDRRGRVLPLCPRPCLRAGYRRPADVAAVVKQTLRRLVSPAS